ncbi:MAG: adenylate/guanylate cyclase domain-containing protein [Hyphomicrobiaceae bacterium]|nr:adenylate/guanylate cyclase domain-containing protein [Hyphomicrobiaceae bacterium]
MADADQNGAQQSAQSNNEELWQTIFAVGHPQLRAFQNFHLKLPSPPRCRMCYAPFKGVGGLYMKFRGKGPANRNPRYCSACDKFLRAFPGGAEVEMSIIFVDIRGSVPLAARMQPAEFSRYMADFFRAATQALIDTDGFVIDFRGDCVVGVYPPGFSGADHASKAVEAARRLLLDRAPKAPDGTPLPIGVGVHTGLVYIGTVSGAEGGIQDLTILGDNVNLAARLSQMAAPGEALISDAAWRSGMPGDGGAEERVIQVSGKTEPVPVHVLKLV